MRKIRQSLQLHFESSLSYAEIGRALGVSKATVGKFVLLARAAGVDWATAQGLFDEQLEARLYRPAVTAPANRPTSTQAFASSTAPGPSA